MKTILIQVKIMNRIKIPLLPKEYKKEPKLPIHLRKNSTDHLNVYTKTIHSSEDQNFEQFWNNEFEFLVKLLPFKFTNYPDYGDTLIGCIGDLEKDRFYIQLWYSKKWLLT